MRIDYSVHQKCKPKVQHGNGSMELGAAVLLRTLRAIDAFDLFDSDGDGVLSREDLTYAFKALRLNLMEPEVDRLWRSADIHGGGKVHIVDKLASSFG